MMPAARAGNPAPATEPASSERTAGDAVTAERRSSPVAATWTGPASDAGVVAASDRADQTAVDRQATPVTRIMRPPANRVTAPARTGAARAWRRDRGPREPGPVPRAPDRAASCAAIIAVCPMSSASTSVNTAEYPSTAGPVSPRSRPPARSCPTRAAAKHRHALRASFRPTAVQCRASAATSDHRRSIASSAAPERPQQDQRRTGAHQRSSLSRI